MKHPKYPNGEISRTENDSLLKFMYIVGVETLQQRLIPKYAIIKDLERLQLNANSNEHKYPKTNYKNITKTFRYHQLAECP